KIDSGHQLASSEKGSGVDIDYTPPTSSELLTLLDQWGHAYALKRNLAMLTHRLWHKVSLNFGARRRAQCRKSLEHHCHLVVNQRLDEVHKEFVKSIEELRENSKGGSPFAPEIQYRPIPTNFCLPSLESYDDSSDPTEHVLSFWVQMVLYDTSDVLMCRPFPIP
ncbi:hypothetical protein GW17_00057862, partial [Ensete ventricosum]